MKKLLKILKWIFLMKLTDKFLREGTVVWAHTYSTWRIGIVREILADGRVVICSKYGAGAEEVFDPAETRFKIYE